MRILDPSLRVKGIKAGTPEGTDRGETLETTLLVYLTYDLCLRLSGATTIRHA